MDKQKVIDKLDIKSFYTDVIPAIKWNKKGEGITRCPFHDDHKPSFSVNHNTGWFFCHACGEKGDIFTFYQRIHGVDFLTALFQLAERAGLKPERKISRTYDYTDIGGSLTFQAVRYEPKGFKQRRPDGKGGWIYNLQGIQLVPYNLPAVVKATAVFIVEGEKDVDTLKELGFVASCNPMGAGKWKPEYNHYFSGKDIFIIGDNDKVGREHALQVAKNLKDTSKTIKVIELPDLKGKDVSDWIEQRYAEGRTKEDIRTELEGVVEATPEWGKPKELLSSLLRWNDIFNLDVKTEYLVDGLIPKEGITLLFGRGGIGKTSFCLQLARAVAEGMPFGGLQTIKTPVYYVDFENPLSVLKHRAENIGHTGNLWVWHISNEIQPPRLDSLEWELYKQLPSGLLIFDTLRSANLSDENNSQDMQVIMARLKELREMGFTILLLHHCPKGNESIYKGSTVLLDSVDHVLGLEGIKESDTEFSGENFYRLGARLKTRFDPHHIFLTFNPDIKGFEIAKDPDYEVIEDIQELLEGKGELNTNQVYELVKKELDIKSKAQVLKLLKKGEGKFWDTEKRGKAVFYSPIVQPIYSQTIGPIDENGLKISNTNTLQNLDNSIKSYSPEDMQTNEPPINENGPIVQPIYSQTIGPIDEIIDLEHEEVEIIG